MVHKSARYGVHSGNTLRSSNTRYSRRYFNEACIISRVHSRLLAKLSPSVVKEATQESAKHEKVHCPNVAIDVALSLNKQARWLLPSALKRQITSEDVADPTLTVSLLERHKLKRHANCVTFCSTHTGGVKAIHPRDGRYFSFAFPSSDGLSNRARRREQRKQRLQAQKKDRDQTVEPTPSDLQATGEEEPADKDLLEGEVRYEVFYPCPWRSSLSHNPKYIKQHVILTEGDDGKYAEQGKSHKKHRQRQRKRMTLKDISNNDDSDEDAWFDLDDDDDDEEEVSNNNTDDWGDGSCEKVSTFDFPLITLLQTGGGVQRMFQRFKTRVGQKKRKDTADVGNKKSRVIYITAETETRDSQSSSKSAIVSPPAEEEGGLEGALPE